MASVSKMPRYRGVKELYAIPMTRGEYNDYRSWDAPEDEDQSVEGYLVEYTDGGEPNDARHKGYISWSPKTVFDAAYRPVESHVDRMAIELDELHDRTRKLEVFIAGDTFDLLPEDDRVLMREQLAAMEQYRTRLSKRIKRAAS